jgi:hypothetical protein
MLERDLDQNTYRAEPEALVGQGPNLMGAEIAGRTEELHVVENGRSAKKGGKNLKDCGSRRARCLGNKALQYEALCVRESQLTVAQTVND